MLDSVVREALVELAEASYQQRVWLAAGSPEVGSLAEARERLFDDSGLADVLESRVEIYGPEPHNALSAWLGKLDTGRSPASLLSDPRLQRVRMLAATALHDSALGRVVGRPDS